MNQLKVADLWNVSITNTSNTNYKIYLQGTAVEKTDGLIVEAKSPVFELNAHQTKTFTPNNIGGADVTWKNNKYKEIIIRTGAAPTGSYTICVFAKQETTGEELGSDCKEQVVEIISPVVLISPENGASVEEKNPVFTWLPPGAGRDILYGIKIVEMTGGQTPEEAIAKKTPFFEKKDIQTTMLQYPVSGKNFETGKNYVWQVKAFTGGSQVSESEIWKFTFGKIIRPGRMITREEAIVIIIDEIIKPKTLKHNVLSFLVLKPLPKGNTIAPHGYPEKTTTLDVPTWFAWIDDDPHADFAHDTRFVFINAYTGEYQVLNETWGPVLNDTTVLWRQYEDVNFETYLIYSTLPEHSDDLKKFLKKLGK